MPARRKATKSKVRGTQGTGRAVSRRVSSRQLDLPAGFTPDGKRLVSLREVLSPETPTMELTQLSPLQQASLTAARIRGQKKFKLGMVGIGVLDKKRAIAEVEAGTPAGQTLVEIENRTLRMVIEKARAQKPISGTKGRK